MPQVNISVDQAPASVTAQVVRKNPIIASLDPQAGRSKHDQLRDLLWAGDWQLRKTQVVVWDAERNAWLLWEE